MIHYVMGLAFKNNRQYVVMIQKLKGPSYVVNKWNAVGGKVEPDETIHQAICREFQEETNVSTKIEDWRHFCDLVGDDYRVSCFTTQLPDEAAPITMETEIVKVWPMYSLPTEIVPNIRWLIPMALDKTETGNGVFATVSDCRLA